jgi:hypothetical protein
MRRAGNAVVTGEKTSLSVDPSGRFIGSFVANVNGTRVLYVDPKCGSERRSQGYARPRTLIR